MQRVTITMDVRICRVPITPTAAPFEFRLENLRAALSAAAECASNQKRPSARILYRKRRSPSKQRKTIVVPLEC